ncbi:hypothetical protein C6503_05900 [Candidatus Poribacteria bacterium]|nr:MAG: hypothetical protein C6503_05900 [Candidatus Poribacteria bacterium]
MADRVFIFHESTDNFRAFEFDGTAQTSENWSPGFDTLGGAAADDTRIVVLDTSVTVPIARFFNPKRQRQSTQDITMNSNDAYSGIALTDTHLVAVNRTTGTLEYYDLTTKMYDPTKNATLPSLTSPGFYSGICRSGEFLYLITHNDSTYSPRFYKRTLNGSAVSDWEGAQNTTALTLFATDDRVVSVRKNSGAWDRFAFDGTGDTVIDAAGPGLWAASYTTFESTEEPSHNAPTDVNVELTPTTAKITWKAPTNGAFLTGYEISYEEGASPGTTWIPTGSLSTRFFVKGLKRSTQYTWQVRGLTNSGPGDASIPVTARTPVASLHNALFFKECVNYFDDGARVSVHGDPTNLVRAVADNNYKTFTREKDLVLNIAVGGNPTRVDAIFVKGIDIEGHSAAPTGGSGSGYRNRRMPPTVQNWEGTDVSTIVNGFSHDLYLLDQHFTATSVRLTFAGTNAKIYEIALLEFGLEIDANGDFLDMNQNFVDREGVVQPDPGGGLVYDSPIGADDRDKWEVDYVVKIVPGKTLLETPEEFLYWQAENRNHFFFMEPSRFPWRGFPAVFVRKSVPVRYRTDDKTGGEILSFRVAEQ